MESNLTFYRFQTACLTSQQIFDILASPHTEFDQWVSIFEFLATDIVITFNEREKNNYSNKELVKLRRKTFLMKKIYHSSSSIIAGKSRANNPESQNLIDKKTIICLKWAPLMYRYLRTENYKLSTSVKLETDEKFFSFLNDSTWSEEILICIFKMLGSHAGSIFSYRGFKLASIPQISIILSECLTEKNQSARCRLMRSWKENVGSDVKKAAKEKYLSNFAFYHKKSMIYFHNMVQYLNFNYSELKKVTPELYWVNLKLPVS